MKKIVFKKEDGGVAIVIPAPKEQIEKTAGKLTKKQYEKLVRDTANIPEGAEQRDVDDKDIPDSREFRDAWVDESNDSCIDICCKKAQKLVLEDLRRKREPLLLKQDAKFMAALRKGEDTTILNEETQALLDVTEPVKALEVEGKLNDEKILDKLRELRKSLD